jgi:hypothetical protein
MADAYQARASVNRWLGAVLPIDPRLPGDWVAYQVSQDVRGNEWRAHWDAERDGPSDQAFSRLVQVDRRRTDGDEVALERELVAAVAAMGLDRPGRGRLVPLYDYPDRPAVLLGYAVVERLRDAGWQVLPDPVQRPGHLRAVITLSVSY